MTRAFTFLPFACMCKKKKNKNDEKIKRRELNVCTCYSSVCIHCAVNRLRSFSFTFRRIQNVQNNKQKKRVMANERNIVNAQRNNRIKWREIIKAQRRADMERNTATISWTGTFSFHLISCYDCLNWDTQTIFFFVYCLCSFCEKCPLRRCIHLFAWEAKFPCIWMMRRYKKKQPKRERMHAKHTCARKYQIDLSKNNTQKNTKKLEREEMCKWKSTNNCEYIDTARPRYFHWIVSVLLLPQLR